MFVAEASSTPELQKVHLKFVMVAGWGAVLGRIDGGITPDEDVEACAERCRVTVVAQA